MGDEGSRAEIRRGHGDAHALRDAPRQLRRQPFAIISCAGIRYLLLNKPGRFAADFRPMPPFPADGIPRRQCHHMLAPTPPPAYSSRRTSQPPRPDGRASIASPGAEPDGRHAQLTGEYHYANVLYAARLLDGLRCRQRNDMPTQPQRKLTDSRC